MKGARFLGQLPTRLYNFLHNLFPVYGESKGKDLVDQKPEYNLPHKYHTISTSYVMTNFDGAVYVDETKIDENCHTHISCGDHRLIFIDIRLFRTVYDLLVNEE